MRCSGSCVQRWELGFDGTVRVEGKTFPQLVAERTTAEIDNTGVVIRTGLKEDLPTTKTELDEGFSDTPESPQQMQVVSDSDEDQPEEPGVQRIKINYINDNDRVQSEIVQLDGTTPVLTQATNIKFVNAFFADQIGTSRGFARGNIQLQEIGTSTTFAQIAANITWTDRTADIANTNAGMVLSSAINPLEFGRTTATDIMLISGGRLVNSELVGGGQRSVMQSNGRIVIPSGHSLGISVLNTTGGTATTSISIMWTEAPAE